MTAPGGGGGFSLRIGEGLLEQWLLQWWERSGALARRSIALDGVGLIGSEASVGLHCPQLALRARDRGWARFECSFEARLSGAWPGAESRFELRCHLLVRPRLDWDARDRLVVSADFREVRIRDARVRPLGRAAWAMRAFDPMQLDPFGSQERLTELGVYALRHTLEGLGERRTAFEHPAMAPVVAALRGAPLRFAVGDAFVTLGVADGTPTGDARGFPSEVAADVAPLEVRIGPRLASRLLRPRLAAAFERLEVSELEFAFETGRATLHLAGRVATVPSLGGTAISVAARLRTERTADHPWLRLASVRIERPRVLAPVGPLLRVWLGRALRSGAFASRLQPTPEGGASLELADLRFEDGAAVAGLRLQPAPFKG